MNERQQEVLEIEGRISELLREKKGLLQAERALSATEVDRIFDINAEIEREFECEAMLLPLLEDKSSQSRWDSPLSRYLEQCT